MIKEIVAASLHYPSGDNSQPFRFRSPAPDQLVITQDETRADHPLNHKSSVSWIQLGILTEIIRLESKKRGFKISVTYPDSLERPLNAELRFSPDSSPMTDDEEIISRSFLRRETNRGLFGTERLSPAQEATLGSLCEPEIRVVFSPVTPEITSFLLKIENEVWRYPYWVAATLKWLRLSLSRTPPPDGLPWRNLNAAWFDAAGAPLLAASSLVWDIMSPRLRSLNRASLTAQLKGSAQLGFFIIPQLTTENLVRLGTSGIRIWTYLNSIGYGYQPVSFGFLPNYISKNAPGGWRLPVKLTNLYAEGVQLTPEVHSSQVIWGFRTGPAQPLPAHWRTGRLSIDQVWDG